MVELGQRVSFRMVITPRLRSVNDATHRRHDTRDKRHTRLHICSATNPRLKRAERSSSPMELDHHVDERLRTNASPITHLLHQRTALCAAALRRLCTRSTSHVLEPLVLEIAGPRDLLYDAERGSH